VSGCKPKQIIFMADNMRVEYIDLMLMKQRGQLCFDVGHEGERPAAVHLRGWTKFQPQL
jgi:hypothetical protein